MLGGVLYATLFPELSKDTNKQYAKFQNKNGSVAHSLVHNFKDIDSREGESNRLDLPAQFAYMSLRDFFWSNDKEYLKEIYPSCKAAVEYALRERDKNGDGLPDMEGVMCSYDNFPMFGVSSFVAGQYVLAFKALSEAAKVLNEKSDSKRYEDLFKKGSAIYQEKLWNGHYFRLCNDQDGEKSIVDEGCLSDQLISQWAAHQIGVGHLYDKEKIETALKSILRMNFRNWQGLRNCQWPGDKYFHPIDKDTWVDQANTCWSGVELAFSSFLIYEGMVKRDYRL